MTEQQYKDVRKYLNHILNYFQVALQEIPGTLTKPQEVYTILPSNYASDRYYDLKEIYESKGSNDFSWEDIRDGVLKTLRLRIKKNGEFRIVKKSKINYNVVGKQYIKKLLKDI